MVIPTCFWLVMQLMARAAILALYRAGRSSAASIAIIAITTRSSIRVNLQDLSSCLENVFADCLCFHCIARLSFLFGFKPVRNPETGNACFKLMLVLRIKQTVRAIVKPTGILLAAVQICFFRIHVCALLQLLLLLNASDSGTLHNIHYVKLDTYKKTGKRRCF